MKSLILSISALAVFAGSAFAANLALGGTYAYTAGPMPQFSGGTYYFDNTGAAHAGYATSGAYDSGDLNDGVFFTTGAPTAPIQNTIVAWDPVDTNPIPASIVYDLGSLANISEITLSSYVYTPFALGAPDDVTISFSADNVSYGSTTLYSFAAATVSGGYNFATGATASGARYVKFEFDGDSQSGDKYSLTEIAIEGTVIPEPSAVVLFGLAGFGLFLRRRR